MDHNQKSIGEAIQEYLKRSKLKPKLDAISVKDCWEEVVGELIARKTVNLVVHNKTLVVHISSAALKSELMFEKEKILKRLQEKVGDQRVNDLVIK